MDIFEYWLEKNRKRLVTLPRLMTSDIKRCDLVTADLTLMHFNQVNNNFNNYVINNGINPVALGYAPISR